MKKFLCFFIALVAFFGCTGDKSTITGLQEINTLNINPLATELPPETPYDFGNVFGGTSRDTSFRVTNAMASTAVNIKAERLDAGFSFKGGTYPGVGGNCTSVLAKGASCILVITYSPAQSGRANTVLKLSFQNEEGPLVTERNLIASSKLLAQLTPSQSGGIDFGNQQMGASATVSVSLNNPGETDATSLTGLAVSAPFTLLNNNCVGTVFAKQACSFLISFAPLNAAQSAASLTYDYFNGLTAQKVTINLSGSGDNGKFNVAKGFDSAVNALLVENSGSLFAGGAFSSYASNESSGLIRLKSTSEKENLFSIAEGFAGRVYTLALSPAGKIYAGGNFTSYRGTPVSNIVRINTDGTLDTGFQTGAGFNGSVFALKVDGTGNLYVGGEFTRFNNTDSRLLIRLKQDGSVDSAFSMGVGFTGTRIHTLALDSNSGIFAGGLFSTYQGVLSVNLVSIRPDGVLETGFNVGTGTNAEVRSITLDPNQSVYLAGDFTSYNGTPANHLVRLNANGTIDMSFVTGTALNGQVFVTQLSNDDSGKLYVGGNFSAYNGNTVTSLIRINPNGSWDPNFPTTQDLSGSVFSLGQDENGSVYLGGNFVSFHGLPVNRLAKIRYSGALDKTYNPGAGLDLETSAVLPLKDSSSSLILAGHFSAYQGVSKNKAAKLNWEGKMDNVFNSGSGFDGKVTQMISDPKDSTKIIMGGEFTNYNGVSAPRITRLSSTGLPDAQFVTLSGFDGSVGALAASNDSTNVIYAGGDFTTYQGIPANRLVRILNSGTIDTAFQVGSGFNGTVKTVAAAKDGSGKVYVGGNFTNYNGFSVNRIVRLFPDGAIDWGFNMGMGFDDSVNVITVLSANSNGIYVGGKFSNYKGSSANSIVRLNSNGGVDSLFNPGAGFDAEVFAIEESKDNPASLYVGGAFNFYQGVQSKRIARLTSSGTYDSVFSVGKGFNHSVKSIKVAEDGSKDIYVGGSFTSYNGNTSDTAVRLGPTGQIE